MGAWTTVDKTPCVFTGPRTTTMPVTTITWTSTASGTALMSEPRYVHRLKPIPYSNSLLQIMLRNIPNKVDQAMLKRIIDESSWGKYDFMYLRIDFANDCK
jgi:hypothetical protein